MRPHAVQPLVVSLCHQRASLEQLGRVAVSRDGLPNMLAELTSAGFREVVVLSTCSRTEVYTVTGGDGRAEAGRLVHALSAWSGLPRQRVEELATTLSGEA